MKYPPGLGFALLAVASCGPAKMIEMPYRPLPAPEPGTGPVDVIRDLESSGHLPPLHTVRLPEGDVEYRFGIVGHMALGVGHTIFRVTRSRGVARGEVWCERLAWELKDSLGRAPHQIARTVVEKTPDWGAIVDSISAIGLMRYAGEVPRSPPSPAVPSEHADRPSERPLIPRAETDQPTLLFEGREGTAYRSFGMYGRTPEDRPEWARVRAVIRSVWGDQHWACSELASTQEAWDPHSTTKWRIRADSTWVQ